MLLKLLSKGLFWSLCHRIESHPTSWQYPLKYYLDPGWDREALLPPMVPPMRDRDRPERPLSGVTTGVPEFFLPGRAREKRGKNCKLPEIYMYLFLWRWAIFSKAIYRTHCFYCTLFHICKFFHFKSVTEIFRFTLQGSFILPFVRNVKVSWFQSQTSLNTVHLSIRC